MACPITSGGHNNRVSTLQRTNRWTREKTARCGRRRCVRVHCWLQCWRCCYWPVLLSWTQRSEPSSTSWCCSYSVSSSSFPPASRRWSSSSYAWDSATSVHSKTRSVTSRTSWRGTAGARRSVARARRKEQTKYFTCAKVKEQEWRSARATLLVT